MMVGRDNPIGLSIGAVIVIDIFVTMLVQALFPEMSETKLELIYLGLALLAGMGLSAATGLNLADRINIQISGWSETLLTGLAYGICAVVQSNF